MGSWGSKPNKKNENNKLLKKNVPKKPKYNFFSKPPDFWFVFNFGLSHNGKIRNTDKNLMTRYKIFDEDLDKDNLAQVFISKIMTEPNTEEQIKVLYDLERRLGRIRSQEVNKNTKPEIKKAIIIIRDNYKKYETQINEKIAELNAKTIANEKSTGTTTVPANSATNSTGTTAAPANSAANSAANSTVNSATTTTTTVNSTLPTELSNKNKLIGGSRKKSKKSRS